MSRVTVDYTRNDGDVTLVGGRTFSRRQVNEELNRILDKHTPDILCEGVDIYADSIVVWFIVSHRHKFTEVDERLVESVNAILTEEGVEVDSDVRERWPIAARVRFPIPKDSFLFYEEPANG